MSKVKQTDKEENDNKVESFKPPMSKVKLDKYTLYISSKSKKVNKKAPKKPKSPSMSKFKSVKTG